MKTKLNYDRPHMRVVEIRQGEKKCSKNDMT